MSSQILQIRPDLDPEQIAARYRAEKFVQIPDFLTQESAFQIEQVLRQETPWRLIYVEPGRGVRQLTGQQLAQMSASDQAGLRARILANARRNIGYMYQGYPMTHEGAQAKTEVPLLGQLADMLNGRAFLSFAEQLISEPGLTSVDAQATLFRSGHFLTRHIDDGAAQERRAAYTLSFTRGWQTDWGGQLQFIDRQTTDVTCGWIPRWNTLTVFDGRRVHAVSPVSSFAGDGRFSIVGWFRND